MDMHKDVIDFYVIQYLYEQLCTFFASFSDVWGLGFKKHASVPLVTKR